MKMERPPHQVKTAFTEDFQDTIGSTNDQGNFLGVLKKTKAEDITLNTEPTGVMNIYLYVQFRGNLSPCT